jgi:GxxExxY protein
MGDSDGLHAKLSYDVIGCAQRVHRALGPGFPEAVYHKALATELVRRKVPFQDEQKAEVFYEGMLCGEFRMDIVVDDKLVLELKALDALNDSHLAQALSYLKATGLHVALLLNFGRPSLEVRRVAL